MFVMVKGRFEKKGKIRLITAGKHQVQRTFYIEGEHEYRFMMARWLYSHCRNLLFAQCKRAVR